jgi:hypothetical protein
MKFAKRQQKCLPPHRFTREQSRLWMEFRFAIHPRFRELKHRGRLLHLVLLTEKLNLGTLSLADADELDGLRRYFELPGVTYRALVCNGVPVVHVLTTERAADSPSNSAGMQTEQ